MERTGYLKAGVSSAALLAISAVGIGSAGAQGGGQSVTAAAPVETVTVTGTSLRIESPIGSNVVAVTAADLAQAGGTSITEMLSTTPQLTGMNVPDREDGNNNGRPGSAIFIHGIGSNGDGTTLILVDGHRAPLSGGINNFVNPNNIPAPMIERVDILTEGASAVYGSDAIAGVVNFITRTNFDGLQLSFNSSMVKSRPSYDFGALMGSTWEKGGFVFAADYQAEPKMFQTSLPWTNPLLQPARGAAAGIAGASNFGNFNCTPATIQPNGTGNIYLSPTSATNVSNSAANATCQQWDQYTLFPSTRRVDAMFKVHQRMGNFTILADLNYANRQSTGEGGTNFVPGTLAATAFSTGPQANPFYINPPGVTATKQTVRFEFSGLLPPAANITADKFVNGDLDVNYDINSDWSVDLLANAGVDDSLQETYGGVNVGLANLALNGTSLSSGSTTASSIPGYNSITLNLPLTTANALDVWDPPGSNKTSAATLKSLTNSKSMSSYFYATEQFRLTTQGTLFNLPAGPVKTAFGAEVFDQSTWQNVVTPENNAGGNVASAYTNLNLRRGDIAEFAELGIPVVSPEMNVPFIEKLDFDLAVRRDDYTDFGSTTNPKASLTWKVNDSYSFRANYSTGFEAPQLSLTGTGNGQAGFSTAGGFTLALSLPVALYPDLVNEGIPGCTAASRTCPINNLQGAVAHTGEVPATAMTGRTYNLGMDMTPDWLPGFSANITYWHTSEEKGTNSPSFNLSVNTPALKDRILLTPSCATAQQLYDLTIQGALPLAAPFPACVQFIEYQDANGYVTFKVDGLDARVGYVYDTDFGTISVDNNLSQALRWQEGFCRNCTATVLFNVLNTDGVNALDPSIGIQNRFHVGWGLDAFVADLFVNWTSAYRNVGSPVNPIQVGPLGQLAGGGDHVNAYVQYDAHIGYTFETPWTGSDVVGLTVKNLLNSKPPFMNYSNGQTFGYDPVVANPLGRTYTLNFISKF